MSINPGSDIVLDVMRAADPTRAEQVTARLDALGAMPAPDPAEFRRALNDAETTPPTSTFSRYSAAAQSGGSAGDVKKKAETELESTVIDSFVKQMLPKDADAVYGQGEAGDIWRSMLSQQISNQIAKNGQLGIARKLFETHALRAHEGKRLSAEQRPGGENAAQASENPLSVSPDVAITDGAVAFARKART